MAAALQTLDPLLEKIEKQPKALGSKNDSLASLVLQATKSLFDFGALLCMVLVDIAECGGSLCSSGVCAFV